MILIEQAGYPVINQKIILNFNPSIRKGFFMKKISLLLLLSYLSIGYVDEFGAIDELATHYLVLSFLNTVSTIHLIFNRNFNFNFVKTNSGITISIILVLAFISIFWGENMTESLVVLSRYLNNFFGLFLMYNLLQVVNPNYKLISTFFMILLTYELSRCYQNYFDIILSTDFNFSYSNFLKSFTGNKNITASAINLKLPFIYFLWLNSKSKLLKIFSFILVFLTFYMTLLLSSRAMILAAIVVLILMSIFILVYKSQKFGKTAFYIIPIVLSVMIFQINYSNIDNFSVNKRLSTLNTEDESVNQRIRFYNNGIEQIIENPLIGVGIGNWKIKSIEYDSQNIQSYVVPYHMHNDFLELGAELGLLGLLLYLFFFTERIFFLAKSILLDSNEKSFFLLLSIIIIFIDSNINFPFQRPIIIIPLMFMIAYSYNILKPNLNIK